MLRSLGVPVRAIHGLFALGIKPKSRDEPTATVDAEGNNLFMGDGQKATNEGGRGLRTYNVVVDWLSHWFHVASQQQHHQTLGHTHLPVALKNVYRASSSV